MRTNNKLSVVINTKNCGQTLLKTLICVKDLADEIIIVDMHSQDETLKIANRFTKKIYQFDDCGYADPARNFAISKANFDWIFIIDSDETIPENLKKEIKNIINNNTLGKLKGDCYFIARKNFIFGQAIKFTNWYPDYQIRLFRKNSLVWQDQVHSLPKIFGKVIYLPAEEHLSIIHQNYQTIENFWERSNNYTTFQVQNNQKAKKNEEISATKIFNTFFDEFFDRYFYHQGYRDNLHGLSLSFLQSAVHLSALLKNWQKQDFKSYVVGKKETLANFRRLKKTLNYWLADYQIKNNSGLSKIYWQFRRKIKV